MLGNQAKTTCFLLVRLPVARICNLHNNSIARGTDRPVSAENSGKRLAPAKIISKNSGFQQFALNLLFLGTRQVCFTFYRPGAC